MDRLIDMRRFITPRLAGQTGAPDSPCPFSTIERKGDAYVVTRDALGQMPVHILSREGSWVVANTIKDLLLVEGYAYERVTTVPNGVKLALVDGGTLREEVAVSYYDYIPPGFEAKKLGEVEYTAAWVRKRLDEVADAQVPQVGEGAVLLSGGVDSMVAAYLFSRRRDRLAAYTMGLSNKVDDVTLAAEYAKAFKVEHRLVTVSMADVVDAVRESVWRSEIYHLYNVYCAVGMVLLGRRLREDRIQIAFTGEGANEAFGDYHNWEVNRSDGTHLMIQSTDIAAFSSSRGRHAYVWGNPVSSSKGFVNKQLGSGLAKHGVSRMHKPLYEYGVQLLSPFMDVGLLRAIACISDADLEKAGGKPGFMSIVMAGDIARGDMPREFLVNRKKTRLQDANPDGEGGITEVLLRSGFDQKHMLRIFNESFAASIADDSRFTQTTLR